MYPKNIKLILAISTLIYSIYQFYENNIGNGIALILLVIIFVFLYFKNEIILIIFFKLKPVAASGSRVSLLFSGILAIILLLIKSKLTVDKVNRVFKFIRVMVSY